MSKGYKKHRIKTFRKGDVALLIKTSQGDVKFTLLICDRFKYQRITWKIDQMGDVTTILHSLETKY